MTKERLIKVPDWKKWLVELFISFIIWGIFSIILMPIANQINIYLYIMSFIIMVIYWIYAYIKAKKYVTIKEFREKNKKGISGYTEYDLKKQKYSNKEIKEILGDTSKESVSFKPNDLKNTFNISNRMLTKFGYGILVDSEAKEFAVIQPNKEIQYIKFNQVHSYNVLTSENSAGTGGMALASLTGNSTLYGLSMANALSGNKHIYDYVIQLSFNDVDSSDSEIHMLNKEMLNTSTEFSEVDKVVKNITSFLDKIITKPNEQESNLSTLKDLKELLDMGAITQEEYDKKKEKLLK